MQFTINVALIIWSCKIKLSKWIWFKIFRETPWKLMINWKSISRETAAYLINDIQTTAKKARKYVNIDLLECCFILDSRFKKDLLKMAVKTKNEEIIQKHDLLKKIHTYDFRDYIIYTYTYIKYAIRIYNEVNERKCNFYTFYFVVQKYKYLNFLINQSFNLQFVFDRLLFLGPLGLESANKYKLFERIHYLTSKRKGAAKVKFGAILPRKSTVSIYVANHLYRIGFIKQRVFNSLKIRYDDDNDDDEY